LGEREIENVGFRGSTFFQECRARPSCFRAVGLVILDLMPPSKNQGKVKARPPILEYGAYPPEAYDFVQQGLGYTVQLIHGQTNKPKASRHVNGPQLCEGIRQYALSQYGMLAATVLRLWNVHATLDFGRIVFALIEAGQMQKTEEDTLEDFRNVFDFKTAFETEYRIPQPA
jgi:uncharacterized repeat protein (TIGR04138 family)